jgi:hypothetical protein
MLFCRLLLEQQIGQDSRPLVVAALEFVLQGSKVALLDWGALEGDETCWSNKTNLTLCHVGILALATDKLQVKCARAILLHLNHNKLSASVGGLHADDMAIGHGLMAAATMELTTAARSWPCRRPSGCDAGPCLSWDDA